MTELEYRNSSISSLVQQLNQLGNKQVLVQQTKLIAIQQQQNRQIKRFQTKTVPQRQFFKWKEGDKKYFYDTVVDRIDQGKLTEFMQNWQKGYNCTILMENQKQSLGKLLNPLKKWIQGSKIFCIMVNQQNQITDVLGQGRLTHRQILQTKKCYEIQESKIVQVLFEHLQLVLKNQNIESQSSTFIDIIFTNQLNCAELHIALLPSEIFSSQCNPPFSLIKTQLYQLLNYIKMNPNKRYEHISKLITKRLPMTNYLAKILMSDSCNMVINWITKSNTQNQQNQDKTLGKLQFFDKIGIISNLLRKADKRVLQIGVIKHIFQNKSLNRQKNNIALTDSHNHKNQQSRQKKIRSEVISPIAKINLPTEHQYYQEKQAHLEQKQLEYCRSLERKTHKFSISQRQTQFKQKQVEQEDYPLNIAHKKTISKYDQFQIGSSHELMETRNFANDMKIDHPQGVSDTEQITILKAQHARQISQYHQTIQTLNRKIMVLTKQLNLEELYKVHQREIMLLQLKIKELRDDIVQLTKEQPNQKAAKFIIKRLTEQIKSHETISTTKKLTQGRFLMIEKQLKYTRQKLTISQKARATLSLEVDALTKRLKIRDTEIQKINQQDLQKYQCEQLSLTEEQLLEDIKKLIMAVSSQQRNSVEYLLRKVSLILSDLSKSRDIILQCNDFLVQLMQILDEKLSKKAPQIVLDCNKFIRSFLLENLAIF